MRNRVNNKLAIIFEAFFDGRKMSKNLQDFRLDVLDNLNFSNRDGSKR